MLCQNEVVIPLGKERAATIHLTRSSEPLGLCGVRVRRLGAGLFPADFGCANLLPPGPGHLTLSWPSRKGDERISIGWGSTFLKSRAFIPQSEAGKEGQDGCLSRSLRPILWKNHRLMMIREALLRLGQRKRSENRPMKTGSGQALGPIAPISGTAQYASIRLIRRSHSRSTFSWMRSMSPSRKKAKRP